MAVQQGMAHLHYGDLDVLHRPPPRTMSTSQSYYDRASPYGHHTVSRHEQHSDQLRRSTLRTALQGSDQDTQEGRVRKRIALACSRCRKRKIRCSGSTGYGGGCDACRRSVPDVSHECTYMRVGGREIPLSADSCQSTPGRLSPNEVLPTSHAVEHIAVDKSARRPSLPILQTRTNPSNAWEYDQPYDSNLLDNYGFSSAAPRHDSVATSASSENARLWQSTAEQTLPATTSYYDQPLPAYTFGNLQYPSYTSSTMARLPSVTSDNWNMNSLHWSLPAQTASERRLPAPNPSLNPINQTPLAEGPSIRPLGMEPNVHINGIHSRTAMPWSLESHRPSLPRNNSATTYPHHGLPLPSTHSSLSESTFGYQFPSQTTTHPETSPATEAHNHHMLPPAPPNFRYLTQPRTTPLPSTTINRRQPSSANVGLYSFSSAETDHQPRRRGSDGSSSTSPESVGQPQHQQPQRVGLSGQY